MRISIVVAAAEDGVIGLDGALPWHLPDDLRHFKACTLGKPVLMGRKTYESIGRALPQRLNLVLSRNPALALADARIVSSLDAAIAAAEPARELMVIGGEAVFEAALPRATLIHLTRVHARIGRGVRLPPISEREWREVARAEHPADERHAYAMSFVTLERSGASRE